jgi:hypothetical protein
MLGLLFAIVSSQLIVMRKKLIWTESQFLARTDSIVLAREYGTMLDDVTDLQQELDARTMGPIPINDLKVNLPPGAPPGIRPILQQSEALSSTDRSNVSEALRGTVVRPERARLRVQYSQRDIERSGAAAALRKFGFQVESHGMQEQPTNGIVVGDSVPPEDIKLITYALIDAGISVSRIRRFGSNANKFHTVQINYAPRASDWPALSLSQINRLTSGGSSPTLPE